MDEINLTGRACRSYLRCRIHHIATQVLRAVRGVDDQRWPAAFDELEGGQRLSEVDAVLFHSLRPGCASHRDLAVDVGGSHSGWMSSARSISEDHDRALSSNSWVPEPSALSIA